MKYRVKEISLKFVPRGSDSAYELASSLDYITQLGGSVVSVVTDPNNEKSVLVIYTVSE